MMMSIQISSKKQQLLCSTCSCLVIIVLFVISLGTPNSIAVAAVAATGDRRNLEHHGGGGDHDDNNNENNNDPQPQPQPQPPPTLPPTSMRIPPPSFEPDDTDGAAIHEGTATIVSETNREEKDIPGVAMEAGVFTTLIAALSATDLVGTLSEPNGPFTVFAPTDDAFAALPDGLLDCLFQEDNIPLVSNILLYHVVSGPVVSSTDLLNMNGKSSIPTLFGGQNLMVGLNNQNGDDVKINDSTVIFPDVVASNGVIHILDQVLVPPSVDIGAFLHTCKGSGSSSSSTSSSTSKYSDSPLPSSLLYDIPTTAMNGGIFTTLVAMLSVTDLVSTLSEPNGPYTVFAPTDDAFAALPDGVLVCLLEEQNLPLLSNILLYHVAPGQTLVSTDLFNGMNIPTLFERQSVIVTLHNNNYGDGDVIKIDDTTILFPDVRASNGMIHIIDQVLIPPSIDIIAFLASSCGSYSRTSKDTHHSNYEDSSSSLSASSLMIPEPIITKDPYQQHSTTGTTASYRQQQPPTMYPTGPDPYQKQHQHEISYYDYSTTTSRTNDHYRQQSTGSTTTSYNQPPTMYPTGTDPYKQEIYYDSSNYYDYSTTTIMNRYHYYAPPLSRRVLPPPTLHPTPVPPTHYPTCSPTLPPTPQPTPNPTPDPTPRPTSLPTPYPTPLPTPYPTPLPTPYPTPFPTQYPTPYYPNKPIIYPDEPYYPPIYPVYQEPKPYNPPPPPKTYPVVYQDPVDENFYQEQPNNDPYYHEDPHPPYYPEPDPAYYDSRQQHNDDPSVGPYVRTHNNPN